MPHDAGCAVGARAIVGNGRLCRGVEVGVGGNGVDGMNDIAALICVVAPLAGGVLLAGVALLWLLFGVADDLHMLFMRWLEEVMPQRPGTACRRPGCAGIIHNGVCSVCGPRRMAAQAQHDQQRGTAAARGYGGRWQRLRKMYLQSYPVCVRCGQPATDVHHIIARRNGGGDSYDNLMALCHSCHSKVTAAGG